MHCAGKISFFQQLPGRSIASNPSTCIALERLVPFSGFLADALQRFQFRHCAGKASPSQRLPDRHITSNSCTRIARARLVLPAASWQTHCKHSQYRIPCRPLVLAELPSVLGSRASQAGAGCGRLGHRRCSYTTFQRPPGRCTASARLFLSAASWQSHCKQFEYMHCAGKVSSFPRLPGSRITSNLCTCTALARVAPFCGFLADAWQTIGVHALR
jgi:hypothetical protein